MNPIWTAGAAAVLAIVAVGQEPAPSVKDESRVRPYTLPDPLLCADGTRVATRDDWERKGRPETLAQFEKWIYGRSPAPPKEVRYEVLSTDPKALEARATRKHVRITAGDGMKSYSFETWVLVPNGAPAAVPCFLLINNRPVSSADPTRGTKDGFWPAEDIIARGYATAVFRTEDVDPDRNGPEARAKGVRGVWPAGSGKVGEDAWATIGAWSWGASRVLDYLQTEKAIDATRVAVIGHSRGGKTALWAGAQDRRLALVISNDSGCCGAALSKRVFGETPALINRGFPYWFCENFKRFNDHEDDLRIDQHQLLALIAPRALYIASASEDLWADPKGEFLSLAHAAPVYALYDLPGFRTDEMPAVDTSKARGKVAYHLRPGPHNLTPYDWSRFMDFADGLWGKPGHGKR